MESKDKLNRREFLAPAAATAAFTLVPRHVLGGPGFVPPSDKLALAYVGCGTQGIREALSLIPDPNVQFVATCDPEKDATNYVDWSTTGIRDSIRKLLEDPNWGGNYTGVRCGRDVLKDVTERYYAKQRAADKFKAINSYVDFRELLEKEKDLDAVKIMTPDHLHATIGLAAMRKKKHVAVHKPISNKVSELHMVLQTQREMGVRTHLLAHQPNGFAANLRVKEMILEGAIGTLREIHNWTDRPFWPQWDAIPTERPPVPPTFNWDMWLGPVPDRPYSPHYTHAVFRGWYEFGGGSIADMGTYSMWPIYNAFDLPIATSVMADVNHNVTIDQVGVSKVAPNDVGYPTCNKVRFTFPAHGNWGPLVLYWYDGGVRPNMPEELMADGHPMPATGTMYVGDKGTILNTDLLPASKMTAYRKAKGIPEPPPGGGRGGRGGRGPGGQRESAPWILAFKNNTESAGDFQKAAAVTEGTCIAAIAMRITRKSAAGGEGKPSFPLLWDAQNVKFTNNNDANQYVTREYRSGWKLG